MHFDLEKEGQKVKFILEKYDLPNIMAEVVCLADVSGSAQDLYTRGTMQQAIQRVLPVAIRFDDNGEVPIYVFNGGNQYALLQQDLTTDNYSDFVEKEILRNGDISKWGGTAYMPVTQQALTDLGFFKPEAPPQIRRSLMNRLSGGLVGSSTVLMQPLRVREKSDSGLPALIYNLTDGLPDDKSDIIDLIRECARAKTQAYFNFLGVGPADFQFLHELADEFPNVGFAAIRDIEKVASSDDIYEFLLPGEMLEWLKGSVRRP